MWLWWLLLLLLLLFVAVCSCCCRCCGGLCGRPCLEDKAGIRTSTSSSASSFTGGYDNDDTTSFGAYRESLWHKPGQEMVKRW